jgi:hypothetical protein
MPAPSAAPAAAPVATIAVKWLLGLVVAVVLTGLAAAADQPISGKSLKVSAKGGGVQAVFVSRDPAVPFPAIGSADDPATGTPGGMLFELFSSTQGRVSALAPAGVGNPGWTFVTSGTDAYRYKNSAAGVFGIESAKLIEGKRLQVRSPLNLALAAPLGTVAVRVTTGSLRSCALFEGASIRRDDVRFIGKNAPASALADCADATLEAAIGPGCGTSGAPTCDATCPGGGVCAPDGLGSSCRCVYPTQPCGTTSPICGGECGAGEQCYPIDDFIPGSINACACAPIGVPPCGATGQTCDTGGCPEGSECNTLPPPGPIHEGYCGCTETSEVCGPGFGTCPPDFQCQFFPPGPGGSFSCVPIFCGGTYPTCGGACAGGRSCVPLNVLGNEFCACSTPSIPCDGPVCGDGLFCPSGEVCTVTSGNPGPLSCACEPL